MFKVRSDIKEIGSWMKSSKQMYRLEIKIWEINLAVFLKDSKKSGKKRVFFNNKLLFEKTAIFQDNFDFFVLFEKFSIRVLFDKNKRKYNLSLNGILFDNLEIVGHEVLPNYCDFEISGNMDKLVLNKRESVPSDFEEERIKLEKKKVALDFFDFEEIKLMMRILKRLKSLQDP